MRRWAQFAALALLLVALAAPVSAGTYYKPGDFDDPAKIPDPNRTVSIAWPSADKMEGKNPSDLSIHTLATNKNEFGPDRQAPGPIVYEDDPRHPGQKKIYAGESQEGLSGSKAPKGLTNFDSALPVHYRVYTVAAPVDPAFYTDGNSIIVENFDNTATDKAKQVKVEYEWSLTPLPPATDKLGTTEFLQTKTDLELADSLGDAGGTKISDPAILGGSAWLPFAKTDATGNPTDVQPAPFGGRPAKGFLKDGEKVPNFSYTASTPGDYDIGFKMKVTKNTGTTSGTVDPNETGTVVKHLEVANLTPPMLMTGCAPGPVFSTTGDPLDNENGDRTPSFAQDDLYTVIWVMSNAHSGQAVKHNECEHVTSIGVVYPQFVGAKGTAFMPEVDQDLKVDPITGEVTGKLFNNGDTFGIGTGGVGNIPGTGAQPLASELAAAPLQAKITKMSDAISEKFYPLMEVAAAKATSMQQFADGTFQSTTLTTQILADTKGQEGLVGTIQLPSTFPMPECQMALLSAFKVKVPITTAPINFEGKVAWSVSAIASGDQPAGKMDGALSVIDNKPPDLTIAVQNPKTGATKILQINNTGGGKHTLAPEPFAVRKGDMSVGDSPTSSKSASTDITAQSTAPPPAQTDPKPTQDQKNFPGAQALTDKGILKADGTSDIVQLPDSFASQKGSIYETIQIPSDAVPADEDVRLTVQIFPTDNVTTWEEMFIRVFPEEALDGSDDAAAKPIFEGTMTKFKKEQDGRFVTNARTTSANKQSRMMVEVFDFDPNQVPYKGPALNPKAPTGTQIVRLFANCRRVIIPVSRGGVSMEMQQINKEQQKGSN